MSQKLVPSDPEAVMVIRDLVPGVTTLSVPFLRFGRVKIGGRGTMVRLQSGNLAVFSPVALTPSVQSKISSLSPNGTVSYIVAPDIEHHIFLSSWSRAFPHALILGPEGLPEKRAEMNKSDPTVTVLPFHTVFSKKEKAKAKAEAASIPQSQSQAQTQAQPQTKERPQQQHVNEEFEREFEYEYVDAHQNREIAFFHKTSRTLIQADLMFNLPATEQYSRTGQDASSGLLTRLFGALQNTRGEATWQRRILWYALSSSDRPGFNTSVRRIAGWDFDNIVPCHGDSIVGNGRDIFRKVFAWHLESKQ